MPIMPMKNLISQLDKIENTPIAEATASTVGNAADTAYTASGLGQLGAMGAKAAKFAPGVAKLGAKFVPGLGAVAGAADAARRASAGDYAGAALSGAAGAAASIPVVGTAASMGLTAIQALRDKYKTGSWLPDYDEIKASQQDAATTPAASSTQQVRPGTTKTAQSDPKVLALQQKILAQDPGALPVYGADGIMGSETQAAMQKLGITAESLNSKGTIMTEAELIAALRNQLAKLDEGLDSLKAGAIAVKDFGSGALRTVAGKGLKSTVDPAAYKKTAEKLAAQTTGRGANKVPKYTPAQIDARAKSGAQVGPSNAAVKGAALVNNNRGKLGIAAGSALGAAGMGAMTSMGGDMVATTNTPTANQTNTQPANTQSDPKVLALQQKILAQDPGALPVYGADGIMGSETQAAMQKLGITAESYSNKNYKISTAESMADLRDRLDELDEAFGATLRTFGRNAWGGIKNLKYPNIAGKSPKTKKVVNTTAAAGARTGAVVASRPAAALYGAGALAAGQAAFGKKDTTPPKPGPISGPKPGPTPTPPGVDPNDIAELDKLAYLLSGAEDLSKSAATQGDVNQLLQRWEKLKQSMQAK